MGIKAFYTQGRVIVKERLKYRMSLLHPLQLLKSVISSNELNSESIKSNYIFNKEIVC